MRFAAYPRGCVWRSSSRRWACGFPYPLYRKSHTTHHRDINLTIPGVDTESYYVSPAELGAHGTHQAGAL